MRIGIMMRDFKLEYFVEKELKDMHRRFEMIDENNVKNYDVVLTDYFDGENCILCHEAKECIRKLKSRLYGKDGFVKIVVGIDPGPKPGIAVVGDGIVVEEIQLSSVSEVRGLIDEVYFGYSPSFFLIRIGDGDITNRNRIINSLVEDYIVELVDEKNTSEAITNRNVESAKVIAFTRGRRIRERLNIVIKEGYLKDIQRKSRIESDGKITISRSLAKRVALGELSLKEAIERARNEK